MSVKYLLELNIYIYIVLNMGDLAPSLSRGDFCSEKSVS